MDQILKLVLVIDSKGEGLDVVLAKVTPDSKWVIPYYSRALSKPKHYCVTHLELLAVVEAINHFRYYLCGLKLEIWTDYASLKWLLSFCKPQGQVVRWIEQLQEFNFNISHWKGGSHTNGVGLSRRPCRPECGQCSYAEVQDMEAAKA